jgi:hypothetical protein
MRAHDRCKLYPKGKHSRKLNRMEIETKDRRFLVEPKFIVQDKESAHFLMPVDGDVGFTPWAHEAGRFDGYAEASDTAELNCHEGFFIVIVLQ